MRFARVIELIAVLLIASTVTGLAQNLILSTRTAGHGSIIYPAIVGMLLALAYIRFTRTKISWWYLTLFGFLTAWGAGVIALLITQGNSSNLRLTYFNAVGLFLGPVVILTPLAGVFSFLIGSFVSQRLALR